MECSIDAKNDIKSVAIVKLLTEMLPQRSKTKVDSFELVGVIELTQKIQNQINANKPIEMITIGFPFKSGNHDLKVIDQGIDMGEFFSLITYEHICQEIHKIHKYGAKLTLHSDCIVYKKLDLFNCLETYQMNLRKLVGLFPSITLAEPISEDIIKNQMDGKLDDQTKKDISYFMESELNCVAWKKEILRQSLTSIELKSCVPNMNGTRKIIILINDTELKFNLPEKNVDSLKAIEDHDIDFFISQCFNVTFVKLFKKSIVKEINKIINTKIKKKKGDLTDFAAQSSSKFCSALKEATLNYGDYIRLSVHPHTQINEKCGVSPIFGSTCTELTPKGRTKNLAI